MLISGKATGTGNDRRAESCRKS